VDRDGDHPPAPGVHELTMTAFAVALLHEAGGLQSANQFTPRHGPSITYRSLITLTAAHDVGEQYRFDTMPERNLVLEFLVGKANNQIERSRGTKRKRIVMEGFVQDIEG
jgi:hypothetical protein